jgi:hypothetical protein
MPAGLATPMMPRNTQAPEEHPGARPAQRARRHEQRKREDEKRQRAAEHWLADLAGFGIGGSNHRAYSIARSWLRRWRRSEALCLTPEP